MEAFSFACRSCAAKLKVANPQLIGQTLACPKCGTMIHVEPPDGWQPPPSESMSQSSLSASMRSSSAGSDFDDVDDLLVDNAPNREVQTSHSPKPSTQKSRFQPTLATAPPPQRPAISQIGGNDSRPPIVPGKEWASQSSRERKKLALMIGSAIGTVLLVAGIIFTIVRTDSGTEPPDEQRQVANDAGALAGDNAGDETANPGDETAKPKEASKPKDGFLIDEDDSSGPSQSNQQELKPKGSSAVISPPSTSPPPIGAAPDLGTVPDLGAAPGLNFAVPTAPGSSASKSNAPPTPLIESQQGGGFEKMEEKIGALAGLLQNSATSIQDLKNVSASLKARDGLSTPKYKVQLQRRRKVDFAKLLELSITEVKNDQPVPLTRSLRRLTSLTGVPISIDGRQLSLMGIEINPAVELAIKNQTLVSAVDNLAAQAGGKSLVGTGVLAVSAPAELVDTPAEFDFPKVGDLTTVEQQQFVDSIKRLIDSGVWTRAESPATLTVAGDKISANCPQGIQRHIQLLIDRMNAAATLAADPANQAARRKITARWTASEAVRLQPVGWTAGRDQSLASFLNRIEKLHGLTVLVDWPSALSAGWHPALTVPGNIIEPTVGQAVQELAAAMQMTVIGIDATTVQVVGRPVANSVLDLEVYTCDPQWAVGTTSQQVQSLILRSLGEDAQSQWLRVIFEPKCLGLIVVAPQPIQRQIEGLILRLNQASNQ